LQHRYSVFTKIAQTKSLKTTDLTLKSARYLVKRSSYTVIKMRI